MKSMNNEGKVLLDDVMNNIKKEIKSVVNHYTGASPNIELTVNQDCAAFHFLLDDNIEVKVTLSPTLNLIPPTTN
ncbi:hypothetical protein [Yersinia mollaretii]|uniref:hypothetical protein n=1 Tax=Yersinia mollaretii TaxID=33060 RepID=UPI0005E0800C|nr:hypothetical protein [Yersinia mollaretii]CNK42115.1 Uncharacterised protein [Yersinia mollaretii]